MRIVFMGTPDFSVPALNALVDAGHEVAAVVTQPDRPKGRGKDVQMTPVKLQALEYGIPVYQPEKVKDPAFVEILKELHPGGDRSNRLRTDPLKGHSGYSALWLRQYPCLPASKVPGSSSHPVGGDRRREGNRRYHHDDGCGTGYGRHAGKDDDPSGSEGNRRKPV